MSTRQHDPVEVSRRLRSGVATAGRLLFGDRVGLVVFLAALWTFFLYWRVGFFITDNHTLANALASLADGHLWLGEPTYGTLEAPGSVVSDGRVYGRNYGQVVAALPVLWAVRAIAAISDLGVVLPAIWSLLSLALATQVGHLTGRRRLAGVAGAGLGIAFLVGNLAATPRPIPTSDLPLLALQAATILQGALAGVVFYRLVGSLYDRHVAAAGAFALVLATPVGFWSAIPKRHAPVTLLVLLALFALVRSRQVDADPSAGPGETTYRAVAYGAVGLLAWVHAALAVVLFGAVFVADVPTARRRDPRALAAIAGAFALSLVPFLVTNLAISGSPMTTPRMLPSADSVSVSGSPGGETGVGTGSSSGGTGGGWSSVFAGTAVARLAGIVDSYFGAGAARILSNPGLLFTEFVYRGYPSAGWSQSMDQFQAINLSVLAAGPILGALGAFPGQALFWWRSGRDDTLRSRLHPADVTSLLVLAGVTLLYARSAPVHAQITGRYYTTAFPIGLYLTCRLPAVRRVLSNRLRTAGWSYAATVLVGTQLLLATIAVLGLGLGEAFRVHELVHLAAAGALAIAVSGSTLDDRVDGVTAVIFGVAAGLGTAFLLLSGLEYFEYGTYALPLVRRVTEAVEVVAL